MASEVFNYFLIQPKLSVIKHVFEGAKSNHFSVTDEKSQISGFGGAKDPELAQTKAVFELIERTAFHTYGKTDLSSSGWAAHSSQESARQNAKLELIERDAILCSWLLRISPKFIKSERFESFGQDFPIYQFGYGENLFILGTVVKLKGQGKKMFLSTTCKSLEEGCEKLVIDSERAKELLTDIDNFNDVEVLNHHQSFCNLPETELSWMNVNGNGIHYSDKNLFQFSEIEVPLWNNSKAFVVKATCDNLQELFYGDTDKYLNRARLAQLNTCGKTLNLFRHPIL